MADYPKRPDHFVGTPERGFIRIPITGPVRRPNQIRILQSPARILNNRDCPPVFLCSTVALVTGRRRDGSGGEIGIDGRLRQLDAQNTRFGAMCAVSVRQS